MPISALPPDPAQLHPIAGVRNTVALKPLLALRAAADTPGNITVGDYSYYSDFDDAEAFFRRNVRYNFGFSGARLHIGKFCALAHGTTFIMSDANHVIDGISSFPFPVFGGDWAQSQPLADMPFPAGRDICLGNDVWCGYEALIMPGVQIGHGAILGARSVVAHDVPDYAIVAGNPARIVRKRFAEDEITALLQLAWWDWSPAKLAGALPLLVRNDVPALCNYAAQSDGNAGC